MNPKERQQSLDLKYQGMSTAANANIKLLYIAREIAKEIALQGNGTCDAELVKSEMIKKNKLIISDKNGKPIRHNWMGSIFKEKNQWEAIGIKKNGHRTAHSRMILRWKYTG